MFIWYKIPHYQCGFCAVSEKMIFPSIRYSFQKRKYVIFLDIGEILEKGVQCLWCGPSALIFFIMDHVTIYLLHKYYRLARICDVRYEIKPFKSSYYIFLSLVEIYRKFYPISFRFVSFRLISFRLISFCFVRFRFVSLLSVFISLRTLQVPYLGFST